MWNWLTIILALLISPPHSTEINFQYSVEGLTVYADAVVCARLIDLAETKDKGGQPMNSSLLLVTHAIKGAKSGDTLCFSWSVGSMEADFNAEGLFFLRRTEQAYGRDGYSCDTWSAMPPEGPRFEWLPLDGQRLSLLSGRGFREMTTEVEIVNACRLAAEAEAEFRDQTMGEEPVIGYLEVPEDTDAYGALYSGSSCYLRVPMFMFRDAKEGFY
jgi:hypothetical protein